MHFCAFGPALHAEEETERKGIFVLARGVVLNSMSPQQIIFFIIFFFSPPARGLDHIAENILSYLDAKSLCAAELVCKEWYRVTSDGMLWKKLIERMVRTDSLWRGLSERRGWWGNCIFTSFAPIQDSRCCVFQTMFEEGYLAPWNIMLVPNLTVA